MSLLISKSNPITQQSPAPKPVKVNRSSPVSSTTHVGSRLFVDKNLNLWAETGESLRRVTLTIEKNIFCLGEEAPLSNASGMFQINFNDWRYLEVGETIGEDDYQTHKGRAGKRAGKCVRTSGAWLTILENNDAE